jgi:hypothetical protein
VFRRLFRRRNGAVELSYFGLQCNENCEEKQEGLLKILIKYNIFFSPFSILSSPQFKFSVLKDPEGDLESVLNAL